MDASSVVNWFMWVRNKFKPEDREKTAYLEDLLRVANGEPVSPERLAQFREKLVLTPKNEFPVPEMRSLLLLSIRKNPDGSMQLVEPWVDSEVNRQKLRRAEASLDARAQDLVFRDADKREGGGWTWDRN